jgi:hypothetical protein
MGKGVSGVAKAASVPLSSASAGHALSERLGRASGSKRATRVTKPILGAVAEMPNQTHVRHRVNAPQVIAETIAGEAMIVNLATGHYFSLQGSGVEIWSEIERERSLSEIVAALEQRYVAVDDEIEAAVLRLVEELEHEQLIVRLGENGYHAEAVPSQDGPHAPARDRQQFAQPVLAKFTDMQDIILLDPVHEVDASGWPHAPASS